MVDIVNAIIEDIVPDIVKADEQAFQMVSTRDLVADQRQYELPTDVAKRIFRVEIKFNGSWVIADEVDHNMIEQPIADETQFAQLFSDTPVRYSLFRNCINIYTGSDIENVTGGLRLYYSVYPYSWSTSDLASSVDISVDPTVVSVGIPREFHSVLLTMTTKAWKEEKQQPLPLSLAEQQVDIAFREALRVYKGRNRDRVVVPVFPDDSGTY